MRFFIYFTLFVAGAANNCTVSNRKDCGFSGIDQGGCEGKGCCWVPATANDVPWCFYPGSSASPSPQPPSGDCNDTARRDCGHSGTDEPSCKASGCCWNPDPPTGIKADRENDYPWCFFATGRGPSPSPSPSPLPSPVPPPTSNPFTQDEISTMQKYFLRNVNIDGSGGVVASPDNATKGGTYYFHWMRDAAITMNVVMTIFPTEQSDPLMKSYVSWVEKVQGKSDPHDQSVLAEPKFMLPTGDVYPGGWCRPQNDGPGLRANTVGQYGLKLLAAGDSSFVASHIFSSTGGTARKDCDFVVANWQNVDQDCDLWEEIRGENFFTKIVQRKGLLTCAKLAKQLGDEGARSTYQTAADAIEVSLGSHWNGEFLYEAKIRPKDSAVILGLLYGYADDDFLAPTNEKVVSTISVFNDLFYNAYSINMKDDYSRISGILWGRYEGDHYAGGNPWVLCTGGLADMYFRQAKALKLNAENDRYPSAAAFQAFGKLFPDVLLQGASNKSSVDVLVKKLVETGDGVMQRIHYHAKPEGFHLPEQWDRNTGLFANAHDLTWSYGSVLLALHNRPH